MRGVPRTSSHTSVYVGGDDRAYLQSGSLGTIAVYGAPEALDSKKTRHRYTSRWHA